MQLFLDSEKFLQNFRQAKDYGRGEDFCWQDRLCHGRGLKSPEDKKAYETFYAVMAAETPRDLDGISLDDLLDCWYRRDDFEAAFQENCAQKWLEPFGRKFEEARTRRRRRVL